MLSPDSATIRELWTTLLTSQRITICSFMQAITINRGHNGRRSTRNVRHRSSITTGPVRVTWYRRIIDLNFTPGIVTSDDPRPTISGMMTIWLDPQGHLIGFHAIPPELDTSPATTKVVDWSPLFEMAGLDPSKLQPTEPQWSSLANSDTRAAWTGTWPGSNRPLRVEAAAWRGKPVFFNTIGDWTHAYRMQPFNYAPGDKARQIVFIIIFLFLLAAAGLLARLNYRRGKGDRQGSFRIALVVFVLQMLLWVCYEHFVPAVGTVGMLILAVSSSLFMAAMVWTLYMALEPYVRKFWPQTIISWSRILTGKIRDPLVGRDVLIGVLLGLSWIVIFESANELLLRLGEPFSFPSTDYLIGGRMAVGATLFRIPSAIQATLLFFAMLLVLRIVFRNQWIAAAAFVAIWTVLKVLGSKHPGIEIANRGSDLRYCRVLDRALRPGHTCSCSFRYG